MWNHSVLWSEDINEYKTEHMKCWVDVKSLSVCDLKILMNIKLNIWSVESMWNHSVLWSEDINEYKTEHMKCWVDVKSLSVVIWRY